MLRKAISLLATTQAHLVDDVVEGKRFFWLGSGISREQVPDVVEFVVRALLALRDLASTGPRQAEHRKALLEIIDDYLPGERSRFESDDASWTPLRPEVLRDSYSEVLGVRVDGEPSDYLLMQVAELSNVYGSPGLVPGPSHLLLAILIAEGVLKTIASGNWDGLVEDAVVRLTGRTDLLDVYVIAEDARAANEFAQIAKFHGCAVLARTDPVHYADKIIATRAQISRFDNDINFAHMRALLEERTTHFRSLVLGLSVQDSDLLAVFTKAAESQPWAWDDDHPAYLFAEPGLKRSQKDVLENCYRADFDANRSRIEQRSAFGTYAQPLLGALVLEVLRAKMLAILARQTTVESCVESELALGIGRVSSLVAASLQHDESRLLDFLTGPYTDLLRSYFGARHFAPEAAYIPLARGTRHQVVNDAAVTLMGADLFAVAVGLVGLGAAKGVWQPRLNTSGGRFMIALEPRGGAVSRLAIVKGPGEADEVLASPAWAMDSDSVTILYMQDRPRAADRSSAGRIGRGRKPRDPGASVRNETCWSDLTEFATSADEIMARLITAVGA